MLYHKKVLYGWGNPTKKKSEWLYIGFSINPNDFLGHKRVVASSQTPSLHQVQHSFLESTLYSVFLSTQLSSSNSGKTMSVQGPACKKSEMRQLASKNIHKAAIFSLRSKRKEKIFRSGFPEWFVEDSRRKTFNEHRPLTSICAVSRWLVINL